jgi:hypothetical protein
MNNNHQSITRTKSREAEKKLLPAIKVIAASVHKTGPISNNFRGYKANAGDMTDSLGRKWQYQIVAVCAKSDFVRKDEVVPMFSGWNFPFKVKAFIKYFIDWANK